VPQNWQKEPPSATNPPQWGQLISPGYRELRFAPGAILW
jgi:hypothetical protein